MERTSDKMETVQGWIHRFLLVGMLLGLSALVFRGCEANRKTPQRKSRQALEDEGAARKAPGIWSVWGSWSPCTQTCGLGIMERSRACLAPAQEATWDQSLEPAPHSVRTHSQPPFHKDTPNMFPYAAGQPSYPLHTDGNLAVPPFVPSVPVHRHPGAYRPPSSDRFVPYARYSRHQLLGTGEGPPFRKLEHHSNQRESVHERETDFSRESVQQSRPKDPSSRAVYQREGSSNRGSASSHRTTNPEPPSPFQRRNDSMANGLHLHQHSAIDSIPLFRPERQQLRDTVHHWDSPGHGASEGTGSRPVHNLPVSPTKEARAARRSRVRDSIKPGKYGYGKVPFALSLHKQAKEAQRLRRHQHDRPSSISRKQKRKVPDVGPTSSTEDIPEDPRKEKPHQGEPLLNISFSGPNHWKSVVGSTSAGRQQDSPPSRLREEEEVEDRPTDGPSQDGKETSSKVKGQIQALPRPVDWSVEEFAGNIVRKSDRTKRQSEEQENRDIGHKGRLGSEDSSEEASQEFQVEKSGEQLYSSEEPLVAPPAGEAEVMNTLAVHLSWSTKRPANNPYPSSAANKERNPLSFKTEKAEENSEAKGPEEGGSKEVLRASAEKATSRERTLINLQLQEEKMFNKMAETSDFVESGQNRTAAGDRLEYQDGSTARPKTMSAILELNPAHEKQSSSLDNQRSLKQTQSHSQQRSTHRPPEHGPYSSRQDLEHQEIPRQPQKLAKFTPQTSRDGIPEEAGHHGAAHAVPHVQQYSRPNAPTSTFHPAGHMVRPRSQRQNEYHPGGFAARSPHSLFREPPPVQRPMEPDMWLSHGVNPSLPHSRGLPASTELQQWNLYHPGTESFHCVGEQKQYKACSQEPCAAGTPDSRAVQCATFNAQEFMGRLYQWEPFTEVQGYQRCELNCRPTGYRFYVRHTEKVQDGTPCEAVSMDICVSGQCLRPGCDGILGSNKTLDDCGTCGGDGKACKRVVGTFNDSNVPIGYHKILEIPKGATKINVTEMTRSPNYLALRSRSGKSVINGNWAVDPPGTYEAGGTEFIYRRPGREESSGGESFAGQGPTTEALDVYMIFQQDNPGVAYQFYVSSPAHSPENPPSPAIQLPQRESSALSRASVNEKREPPAVPRIPVGGKNVPAVPQGSQSRRPFGTLQRNVRVPPLPAPSVHNQAPEFYWRRVGNTECSATCGKGFWSPVFRCVSRTTHEESDEAECDLASMPATSPEVCSTQPCPAFWDMGEWSACSKSCGAGIQHRQLQCRQMYANRTTMVHPQRCSQLPKPNATQPCQMSVCSHWEIRSNWTSCSVLCGLGQRTRHVRCISNHGNALSEEDCSTRLRPRTSEACDMGPCVRSWFHNEWSRTCSAECGTGIQRRAVICLSSDTSSEFDKGCVGSKPADMRACNNGPCHRAIQWYTGPWGQCSAECDDGTQRRDVICVSKLGSEFSVTDPSECASLEKPPSLLPCNAGSCGARWFTTPWSACSKSCLRGLQVREVRCLTENRTFSRLCDPDVKPLETRACSTQMCALQLDETCKDKHHNCPLVVQARLCVYSYYKMTCCASCARALDRTPAPPSR